MRDTHINDKLFEKNDFAETGIAMAEFDGCSFLNCNFLETDLSGRHFSECSFTGCNLSMARLDKTAFRDVKFNGCKLLGLHFEHCDQFLFTVEFDSCKLDLASFFKMKIKKTVFRNCSLHDIDFAGSDLSASVFENCDLYNATFDSTILEKADLRTSFNYTIDPAANKIRKAKFSREGVVGLLYKFDIEIE